MLRNQFVDIQASFQKSINIPRHKHRNDSIFDQIICRISLEAMELISKQLEAIEGASPLDAGKCKCPFKVTHGLPCRHDLAFYRFYNCPIPLQSIHVHWRILSMRAQGSNDTGVQPNRTHQVVELLDRMDPNMRDHMIGKIIDMADPSQSTVRPPSCNTEHRGRPSKDEQSTRRIPSFFEKSSSESGTGRGKGKGKAKGVRNNTQSSVPPDPYIQYLPQAYHPFISHTVNVRGDGNCGFRAIAAQIYGSEDQWSQVRSDLAQEIIDNKEQYDKLYPETGTTIHLLEALLWFDEEHDAPPAHWMDAMILGIVIASKYNIVLHTFDATAGSCFTHLPLRPPRIPVGNRREIAIARVGNHFVQVFLRPHYPVPPIPIFWWNNASNEGRRWAATYSTRLQLWNDVMGTGPRSPDFGGDIN